MSYKIEFRAFFQGDIDINQPHKFVQKVINDTMYFVMESDEDCRYHFDGVFHDHVGGDWILQQWTGLTDKNGVKIFEGDILQTKHSAQSPYNNNKNANLRVVRRSKKDNNLYLFFYEDTDSPASGHQLSTGTRNRFEVVGNIFEGIENG